MMACVGCGGGEPTPAEPDASLDADFDGVPVASRDLQVGEAARVRVSSSGDAGAWQVEIECREIGGCAGQLRATIYFSGTRGEEIARVTGRVAVADGEMMTVQGVRRPAEPVTAVDRVELAFTGGLPPQAEPNPGLIRPPTPVRPTPYD